MVVGKCLNVVVGVRPCDWQSRERCERSEALIVGDQRKAAVNQMNTFHDQVLQNGFSD